VRQVQVWGFGGLGVGYLRFSNQGEDTISLRERERVHDRYTVCVSRPPYDGEDAYHITSQQSRLYIKT
jgi:hypothetical protein